MKTSACIETLYTELPRQDRFMAAAATRSLKEGRPVKISEVE